MFSDLYIKKAIQTKSHLCVGLDPILSKFPSYILKHAEILYGKTPKGAGHAIFEFNKMIIDCTHDKVPAIKPQLAYYEKYDQYGIEAFWKTVEYAKKFGLIVIADAKRGDIDTTSQAYADSFFKCSNDEWRSHIAVDAVTVNPYLGSDGLNPFINESKGNSKGTIILVKTSNSSSGDLQDQIIKSDNKNISELVCDYIKSKSNDIGEYGFSDVAAVIGATYPKEIKHYRKLLPNNLFLVPGIGYQGGDVSLIEAAFNEKGLGAIIACSRAINYSFKDSDADESVVKKNVIETTNFFNELINDSLSKANKIFWKLPKM